MTSELASDERDSAGAGVTSLDSWRGWRRAPFAGIAAVVCVLVLIALALAVKAPSVSTFDRHAELAVHADVSRDLYGLMTALSFVGQSGSIAVLAFACAVFYLRAGDRWSAAIVVACPTGAAILDSVLKELFHRHRPHLWPHAAFINSYSFPSGHATVTSAFFAGITYVAWQRFGPQIGKLTAAVCAALIAGIGFSRVYLGVHWPSDVLAGYALGLAWASLVIVVAESARGRTGATPATTRQDASKSHVRPQVQ